MFQGTWQGLSLALDRQTFWVGDSCWLNCEAPLEGSQTRLDRQGSSSCDCAFIPAAVPLSAFGENPLQLYHVVQLLSCIFPSRPCYITARPPIRLPTRLACCNVLILLAGCRDAEPRHQQPPAKPGDRPLPEGWYQSSVIHSFPKQTRLKASSRMLPAA